MVARKATDGDHAGDDESYASFGAFTIIIRAMLVEFILGHALHQVGAFHGAEDKAVLYGGLADVKWGEQNFVILFHGVSSYT